MNRPIDPPSALFFDLDGTLVDSAPDLAAAADHLRQQRGLPPLGTAAYRPAASAGARGLLAVAFGLNPDDPEFEVLRQEFLAYYSAHIADHSVVFAGIPELLATLQARGIPWGIITNKAEQLTHTLIAALPLLKTAAAIVGGDSASAPKPDAAPMHMAAAQAGIDLRRAWYVGDDARDIQAARAGQLALAIAAGWGYAPAAELAHWQADFICPQALDLLALFA